VKELELKKLDMERMENGLVEELRMREAEIRRQREKDEEKARRPNSSNMKAKR
jgi:hypothetical protein